MSGFTGDTEIVTRYGDRPLRTLVGARHLLLNGEGEWVNRQIECVGVARVTQVVLRRSGVLKTIRASSDHRWPMLTRCGRRYNAESAALKRDARTQLAFAKRPDGRKISSTAAAAGFVFGDGTRPKGRTRSIAYFCGEKDDALLPYFAGLGNPIRTHNDVKIIGGLPGEWKSDYPSLESPSATIYGWLAGYFAADGDVGKTGRPTLSSSVKANLEFVRYASRVVGVGTFGVRQRISTSSFSNGAPATLYLVGLMRGDLESDFFLIPEHRRRFEAGRNCAERRYWRVLSVTTNVSTEPIYMPVGGKLERFTLSDNIVGGEVAMRE